MDAGTEGNASVGGARHLDAVVGPTAIGQCRHVALPVIAEVDNGVTGEGRRGREREYLVDPCNASVGGGVYPDLLGVDAAALVLGCRDHVEGIGGVDGDARLLLSAIG